MSGNDPGNGRLFFGEGAGKASEEDMPPSPRLQALALKLTLALEARNKAAGEGPDEGTLPE